MDDQTSDPNPIKITVGDPNPISYAYDGASIHGVYPLNPPTPHHLRPENSKHGLAVWANAQLLREDFDYKVECDDQEFSIKINRPMNVGDKLEVRRESKPPVFLKLRKVR